jgi:hypothetical protein
MLGESRLLRDFSPQKITVGESTQRRPGRFFRSFRATRDLLTVPWVPLRSILGALSDLRGERD